MSLFFFLTISPSPLLFTALSLSSDSLELHGIAGAAIEHKTLLGRILRLSPDSRDDPKIRDLLKESHRQPRNIVEGNMANLR